MAEENLVTRRSKRSTAGNRMQEALAEIAAEDLSKEDPEEDKDFVVETYEEDAFESDFESTDEEAAAAEQETTVENEEKQARKAARSRLKRATAAAAARQKITFDPTATTEGASTSTPTPTARTKCKRRVSIAIDALGENEDGDDTATKKRSSKRQTTIQNTTDTVKRYLQSEEKKASQPRKRFKSAERLTQAQLLARALDNEEGNLVDHRDYLMLEEEKRQLRARRDKVAVTGPLLRWVSKAEEVQVEVKEEPQVPAAHNPSSYGQIYPSYPTAGTSSASANTSPARSNPASHTPASTPFLSLAPPSSSSYVSYSYPKPATTPTMHNFSFLPGPTANSLPILALGPPGAAPPPPSLPKSTPTQLPKFKLEKVTKTYLVHELSQDEDDPDASKPDWESTMEAVFGNHVKWQDVMVYSGKNRPLARHIPTCPITGTPAKYLDPQTGVPFADVRAYKLLMRFKEELVGSDSASDGDSSCKDDSVEVAWDDSLGCYVGVADFGRTSSGEGDSSREIEVEGRVVIDLT
ncbi:YL1 nuclear protein-domain-containing protein [Rhodocollybia butyracea]|uniref:YL1 nuclear protein-domain-containing protein n=1 Tax=Rhodocollybia butyracea TaxID=206335 RepID=A0A9P5UCC4_9AGAR|nr:YL1 nuclear protein-domain-containing protein [Rhodocollybia butyracea]